MHPNSTDTVWTAPPPEADVLLGDLPFDGGVETVEFFSDPFCLVISEELLTATLSPGWEAETGGKSLTAAQLDTIYGKVPFHLVPDQVGSLPLLPISASSTPDKLDMVTYLCRTGRCASLFPHNFASHLFDDAPHIRTFPLLEKGMCKRVGLCTKKGKPQSAVTRAFIQVAKEYFSVQQKTLL